MEPMERENLIDVEKMKPMERENHIGVEKMEATITGTKFQLGDKVVAETTVAELVNGYNLNRKDGTPTYTVTMVGLDQSSREWIKIDGTNQSVKSANDFVLFSELRDIVMKRLTNRLLRMMSYDY